MREIKNWSIVVRGMVAFFGLMFVLIYVLQDVTPFAEAKSITKGVHSFEELAERFEVLATEKGGVYAFEVLKSADVPPNTDMHLLAHRVGDILYLQEGLEGIRFCTQDFRNACSHTTVVGALTDFGENALSGIRDACKKAPGGSGAYTMCYHGLGHGVFAYFGYSLPETIAFCKKTGTSEYEFREYHECVGGAIMELMGGGGHDKVAWEAARTQYLSETDPLSPCSSTLMPSEVKRFCYMYITPQLFESGGSLAQPGPIEFNAAFSYCDRVPRDEAKSRYACFNGIGKEFPVLSLKRDIRQVESAGIEELTRMNSWCSLAPHIEAYEACREAIQDSLFWGGENDTDVSLRFCSIVREDERSECYVYLGRIAKNYVKEPSERAKLCASFPLEYRSSCEVELI